MTELLVVIAIITVLSALLFPVFSAAKRASERAGCTGNLRQLTSGTLLYTQDYDDRFMPVNHQPGVPATSRTDRTWVQVVLPYVRSFAVFHCPGDHTDRPRPEATFDEDLVPGDTDSQYYTASLRSDYGYNNQNLAPIVLVDGRWDARPRSISEVVATSSTLLFVDSAWERDDQGNPRGGGNWLVVPPCRYYAGTHIDSFTGLFAGRVPVFTTTYGWNAESIYRAGSTLHDDRYGSNNVGEVYGNAWPWHGGFLNEANVDGSIRAIRPRQLGLGCDVRDAWRGDILDTTSYIWDVR